MSVSTHTLSAEHGIERIEEHTPTILQLYDPADETLEEGDLGHIEGTITVFWATKESGLVGKYERALQTGDKETALEIREQVFDSQLTATDSDPESDDRAELVYGDECLKHLPLSEDRELGSSVITYDGGSVTEDEFTIRTSHSSYEFGLIVAPPLLSEAERDASESVSLDIEASSMPAEPGAHVATLAPAALLVTCAAERCEANNDIAQQVTDWEEETDGGAHPSVDELVAECEEQLEKLS